MGLDLATWRTRHGLNQCRYAYRPLPVQWRAARWGVGEVVNSTPLVLQGCMAVVSLSLILEYAFRKWGRCPKGKGGCGKVRCPKFGGGSVSSAEARGMVGVGSCVCLLLRVCAVVLSLLLMAGDVERNPGPTRKEGSDRVDKMLLGVDDSPLGEKDLFDVLAELMLVVGRWKAIGEGLRLDLGTLEQIETMDNRNPRNCMSATLKQWLRRNYDVEQFGEPTWRAVVKVVGHSAAGNNCALAMSIAGKHAVVTGAATRTSTKSQDSSSAVPDEGASVSPKPTSTSTQKIAAATPQPPKQTPSTSREDLCASSTVSDDVFTSEGASVSPRPSSSTQSEGCKKPPFGCGCGKCTFYSYIESGCSHPIPSASSFPCLDFSRLTHEQQQELQSRLCVESEDIMIKFQHLFSTVYESLCARSIPVDKLVTHLMSWGAFDPVVKGSEKPVFQTFRKELQTAGSIEKVLWVIRDYFSFFNYHVIEHIVSKLGTDQDKAELRNYKEKFDCYSKRRVYECLPVFGPVSEDDHVDLVLKIDSMYEQFTVEAVKKFRYRLKEILHVSQGVLRLCRVDDGCFQVLFQVPSFMQQEIFPLSSEQERALVAEGVIKLTCGNYEFVAKGEEEDDSEPEDTDQRKSSTGDGKSVSTLLDGQLQQSASVADSHSPCAPQQAHVTAARPVGRDVSETQSSTPAVRLEVSPSSVTNHAETDSAISDALLKVLLVQTLPTDKMNPENVQPGHQNLTVNTSIRVIDTKFDILRGVDVIAETHFVLTKVAQSFVWEDYGFKLHVPESSLPEGLDQCEVKIKVSLSGHFDLPENSELVSAVYWVYSRHSFLKPLTVEIQHCAAITTPTQCARLMFVRTKCTQKELPYIFKEMDGGSFKPDTAYGSISLMHFSGIAISKKLSKASSNRKSRIVLHCSRNPSQIAVTPSKVISNDDDEIDAPMVCCGQLYTSQGVNYWTLDFVVTKNLDVCLKVIEDCYTTRDDTRKTISFIFEFESEKICLDVPDVGLQLKDHWKMYPLYTPCVKKSVVEKFNGAKTAIPKCEMMLEWQNEDVPPKRMHQMIGIQGARDHKFFRLVVDPVPTGIKPSCHSMAGLSTQSNSGSSVNIEQIEPELRDFQNLVAVQIPEKWQQVGTQLGLEMGQLRGIAQSARGDPRHCFDAVFTAWRSKETEDFSWEAILRALRSDSVGEPRLANTVSIHLASHES